MNQISPTENQKKLFALLADFSVQTVTGWISNVYKLYGPRVVAGDALTPLILRFAEEYFNCCARWLYNRRDEYINRKFDEMLAIRVGNKYDPIDLLHIIVMISLNLLQDLNICDVISDNYVNSMEAVVVHLKALASRHSSLSANLLGCTPDHKHEPVGEHDRVFSFAYDKYVMTDRGAVKLTDLD